ncbi:MAG TPA: YggT family protein [Intrasporangium sp.]|nr:YggT family protein [Intrasporangium sp.]
MDTFWTIYGVVVFIFFIALIGRFVIDWVQVLSRSWQPKGPLLVVAEAIYTVTDPPLRALRKIIPSPNLGGVRLDLSFLVLMLLTSLALNLPSFLGAA